MRGAEPLLTPMLIIVCVVMALAAAAVNRLALNGSVWEAPSAAVRAALQLAAVSTVLAVALQRVWSSMLVLVVMFIVASITAARRSQAHHGAWWLTVALAAGMVMVIPLLTLSGVVPFTGVAVVPVFGIVLGGTMTASAVAARRALDALTQRAGEVEAALSLGLSERFSRMLVIERPLSDALLPNLDQTRTAGLVTLPGAFVGVLLATGSAAQAAAVQVLVLVSLLLAQVCGVAVVGELVVRGRITRQTVTSAAPDQRRKCHRIKTIGASTGVSGARVLPRQRR
ncbi:ABC transporter permease [Mycolicibacterium mucogenicum]|uniref:ABC transporter permease n=1 Tax=Mycolicibacterium mucogenicum DSM 44124 TaxID=1226753 RepID=A0A8H2JJV3_MYCMU|nr:ABC transporter permease [Mycolicibacterium mucogenicum]QPG68072.1 ABC transporter permease [Mycolicibacterium mucogenicum DSM 44124]